MTYFDFDSDVVFFLACPLLSQPEPGIEFRNSSLCPQSLQLPMLTGPLGWSITQWWVHSSTNIFLLKDTPF